MFKLFNRKPRLTPKDPFADMNRAELATAIKGLLADQEPSAGLMTMVAVRAQRTLMRVAKERSDSGEKSNTAYSWKDISTIEFMMRESYAGYSDERDIELERLRPYWLYIGGGVIKASDGITAEDPENEDLVDIWKCLVTGLPYIKGALTHSQLWQEYEKKEFLDFIVNPYPKFYIETLLIWCGCPYSVESHPDFIRAREEALYKLSDIS